MSVFFFTDRPFTPVLRTTDRPSVRKLNASVKIMPRTSTTSTKRLRARLRASTSPRMTSSSRTKSAKRDCEEGGM